MQRTFGKSVVFPERELIMLSLRIEGISPSLLGKLISTDLKYFCFSQFIGKIILLFCVVFSFSQFIGKSAQPISFSPSILEKTGFTNIFGKIIIKNRKQSCDAYFF